MYRDAQEELKRLEEALLEGNAQPEETKDDWEIDLSEALADIPDLPEKEKSAGSLFGLGVLAIFLLAAVAGLAAYLIAR